MDQDQAINLLDTVTSQQRLTRQEHEQVQLSLHILRELSVRFKTMVIEKTAQNVADAKTAVRKRVNPEIKPPDPKEALDNIDRSEA